jgi:biopolymer transport protein ExbD
MKIKRKHRFAAEISTSSLNDIMFFLLLFFLIVSTVANPNVIKLVLPRADSPQAISKKQITLSVTGDQRYFIDKQEVPIGLLEDELKSRFAGISEPTIVLRIDNSLVIQNLVDVLQIGTRLHIKMVLATQKTGS